MSLGKRFVGARRASGILLAVTLVAGLFEVFPQATSAAAAAGIEGIDPADLPALPSQRPRAPELDTPQADPNLMPPIGGVKPRPAVPGVKGFDPVHSVVASRTATSTIYDNADGTQTARIHAVPVNFRDPKTGQWKPFDNKLLTDGDSGYRQASGPASVRFADATGSRRDLVTVADDDWSIGFRMDGATSGRGARRLDENRKLRYADVRDGVSLEYHTEGDRVKEQIVLSRPPRGQEPTVWRFPLTLEGVTPFTASDGTIEFRHEGEVVASVPRGYAVESTPANAASLPATTPVETKLVKSGNRWRIDVAVERDWLVDPARVYPVYVDPTVFIGRQNLPYTSADAHVGSGCGNCNFNGEPGPAAWQKGQVEEEAYIQRIGKMNFEGGPWEFYSYFWYDIAPIRNHTILGASWKGYFYEASNYTNNTFALYPVNGAWSFDTITWDTKAGHRAESVLGHMPSATPQWVSRDITSWVANWASGAWAYHGLTVDTMGVNHWLKMAAVEQAWQNEDSTLEVTYNNQPATPGALLSPADGATVMTTTPTISANPSTDADGDPLRYALRIGTSADAEEGHMVNITSLSPSFTVPVGSLQHGETYYWKIYTFDGTAWSTSPVRKFTVDLRLGANSIAPQDSVGPLSVNLATGNVNLVAESPSFNTVSGPIGVSYSYNSAAPSPYGLDGDYISDCDPYSAWYVGNAADRTTRRDANIDFSWPSGSPIPGSVTNEWSCVRWNGWVTLPRAQTYCFTATNDDGVRAWVGAKHVIENWDEQANTQPSSGSITDNCVTTTMDNQSMRITVDHMNVHGGAFVTLRVTTGANLSGVVPASWLSPSPPVLPAGWNVSVGTAAQLTYASARVNTNSITLTDVTGATHEFTKTADGVGGAAAFKPPPGHDSVVTMGQDGTYGSVVIVTDGGGVTYTFTSSGKLVRAESADGEAAAPVYGYNVATGRLDDIRDPVSGRVIRFRYSPGPYTGAPSQCDDGQLLGFQQDPPTGFLCKVEYWDGTATKLFYLNDRLARILDPGDEVTDIGYDSSGRPTRLRDPLLADKAASNPSTLDNDTTRVLVAYDANGRASSVTLPVPNAGSTPADPRPSHSYEYTWTPGTVHASGGTTKVHVAGLSEPNGYARKVLFDAGGRTTEDWDSSGLVTRSTWKNDRLVGVTQPTGLRATTVYDHAERVVESWGPAPATCFGAAPTEPGYVGERPTSCSVPSSTTAYDEGIQGLGATYWSNRSQTGRPVKYATGVGGSGGALSKDWLGGAPAGVSANGDEWSGRFVGEIRFPTAGTYKLKVCADDGVRLFVDDLRLVDSWVATASCRGPVDVTASAGQRRRIRVDYFEATGNASIDLRWIPPGGAEATVPGANLSPRYNLATSQRDADGNKAKSEFAAPELGLQTASIVDPDTLALRSEVDYEAPGTGYFRRTARRLPKGAATQVAYSYYGATELAPVNDCSVAGVVQAGMLKRATSADPPGADGPIVREYVYDARGRVAGTKVQGDTRWSCVQFDARGRQASTTDRTGRTETTTYGVDTATTSYKDSAGSDRTTASRIDLLGRPVAYTDELGTTTRSSHDQTGRTLASYRKFPGESETTLATYAYDAVNRLASVTEYLSGGPRTTTIGYDAFGRPSTKNLPNGVVTTNGFDPNTGAVSAISHAKSGSTLSNWSYVRSTGGRVTSESTTGRTRTFGYDGANRLKTTTEGSTTRNYAWDANSNRCARATACDGTYTYDDADRITSSPEHSAYVYDAHGNVVSATPRTQPGPVPFGGTFAMDASTSTTPQTYPVTVGQDGTLNASVDWTTTGSPVTTGTETGSLAVAPASTTKAAASGPFAVDTELKSALTWTQGVHRPTETSSVSVPAAGSGTRTITTAETGDIVAALDWPTVRSLSVTGTASNTPTTTPQVREGTFTLTGNGTINLKLTWDTQTPPQDLELDLYEDGVSTPKATSRNPNLVEFEEEISFGVTDLGTTGSRTYRYKVFAKPGSSSSFTLTGTYPVNPTMDFRLENASGTTLATSTPVASQPKRTLSYASAPAGTYVLRALSAAHDVTATVVATYSKAEHANVTVALKQGTTTLTSGSSSTGTLNVSHVVPKAGSTGSFTWVVTNNSSTLVVPSFTLSKTTTSLGSDTSSGLILPAGSASRQFVAEAGGFVDAKLTWNASTLGTRARLTLEVRNAAGAVVASRQSESNMTLTTTVPTAGTYTVVITNNSVTTEVPSYTLTSRFPQRPAVALDAVLKNAAGTVVATATGSKPKALSTSVTPGAYTVVVTPTAGKADVTVSGNHPTFPNRYNIEYDANDHATRIDDGRTTVAETLSPSGRVLRRVVTEVGQPTPVEDTVFGYDGDGDSPAYERPTAGGTVTTHLGDATYTGTTGTWALSNLHGDIAGTTDAAGAFTATPVTDEFGVGSVPADRRGWLGAHDRLSVGGRLGIMRMGVRLYDTNLGRFLQVDPVEGGCSNDYAYVFGDPVNSNDLSGEEAAWQSKAPCLVKMLDWFVNEFSYISKFTEVAEFLDYMLHEIMDEGSYKLWDKLVRRKFRRDFRRIYRKMKGLGRIAKAALKMNRYVSLTATAAHWFCLGGFQNPRDFLHIWDAHNNASLGRSGFSGGGATGSW